MSDLTLSELIRQVADEHPGADPRELARHVAKMTPADLVGEFYEAALIDVVRAFLGDERRRAFTAPNRTEATKATSRSYKRETIRSWWADVLRARVHVGGSQWKTVGECTREDLLFCIEERAQLIASTQAQIEHYKRLIQLMEQYGAQTVADLPPQEEW